MSAKISRKTLQFLKDLSANNNKPWFTENKDRYLTAYEEMKDFRDALMERMSQFDNIEKIKLYRIYRDVRFAKDKSPYKNNFSGGLTRATKLLRGGYYFSIEPKASMIAGGFFAPNSADLKRIRDEIAADATPLRQIIADSVFKKNFGSLSGSTVKTAPRGFAKDHPDIDLIRHKQFIVTQGFTDKLVTSPDFLEHLIEGFLAMRPYFDYMSEVLTTDKNGVPLYD